MRLFDLEKLGVLLDVCDYLLFLHHIALSRINLKSYVNLLLLSCWYIKGYIELCNRVTAKSGFESIQTSFESKIEYEVSGIRVVEQIMFHSSGEPLNIG